MGSVVLAGAEDEKIEEVRTVWKSERLEVWK